MIDGQKNNLRTYDEKLQQVKKMATQLVVC